MDEADAETESEDLRAGVDAETIENLRRALESRAGIEQAKGIVMAVRGCTPDEAFDTLREISQRTNRKLVVVAAEVVERAQQRRNAPAS